MTRLRCDLHVHSCLSPCGEDDMTPFSIAGMSKLNGMDVVALTDHNTCGNCRTFLKACEGYGIIGMAGMELTSAEDVHLVCLFPDADAGEAFEKAFRAHRIPVKNRPEIFGRQLLIGMDDEPVGEEENLLINASDLSIGEAKTLAESFGGAVYPAHVDREGNGVIATLGDFPSEPSFAAAEFHSKESIAPYTERYPALGGKTFLVASDAHRLDALPEDVPPMELDCDGRDAESVRRAIIRRLGGKERA